MFSPSAPSAAEIRKPLLLIHSEASLGWGGQEHRVFTELNGFKSLGHRVALVAPEHGNLFARCAAAGIPCFHTSFARRHLVQDLTRLTFFLKQQRPAVVNTHSSRDGWCMGLASRLAQVPLLIRSRHIDVDYKSPIISRHAFTTLADHVITTSNAITQKLERVLHVQSDRISTMATGIDLTRFSSTGPKAELPRPAPGPLIGMISVLRSWKGHDVFFQAVRLLHDSGFRGNFVVVGGGAAVQTFREMARARGVEEFVHFTGHREDVPELLRALDLLLIPSTRHEGIPQIGLQALACGTPAIGSSVGGIPEILRHGETGRIFAPNCPHSLAECIRTVFQEPDKTAAMVQKGAALVESRYSLEALMGDLLSLYQHYLGDHPAVGAPPVL